MDEEHVVVPFGAHMYAVRRAGDANALGALPASGWPFVPRNCTVTGTA